jgi:Uma2 family endonuclease
MQAMLETAAITFGDLEVPFSIQTLDGFREWFASLGKNAPRASFIKGRVYIDMTPQDNFTHEPLVSGVNERLRALARELDLGRYFFPPTWISHDDAVLSTEPDGFLVTWERFESGLFRLNPERPAEAIGCPTMVFEAVSAPSQKKDLVDLAETYFHAGVEEYWIADARDEKLVFKILVRGKRAFREQRRSRGWVASRIWARSFRIVESEDRAGLPVFTLEVK